MTKTAADVRAEIQAHCEASPANLEAIREAWIAMIAQEIEEYSPAEMADMLRDGVPSYGAMSPAELAADIIGDEDEPDHAEHIWEELRA